MATKDTEKFLKDLNKFVGKNLRTRLNQFYTKVTMTSWSLGQGFKEGYEMVKANRPNSDWPEVPEAMWKEFGGAAVDAVFAYVDLPRSWPVPIRYQKGDHVVYGTRRDVAKAYRTAKDTGVRELNKYLKSQGGRSLRGMKAEKDLGMDLKAASQSEVGMFKQESHRAHQGVTTVGAAQMSAAMKFLELTKDFAGFSASEEAKDIMEIYEHIEAVWETTGTKAKGAKVNLKENQSVGMRLGARSVNKVGAEPYDWKNLKKPFEESVRAYLEKIPLAERSGSKSIRENAEDQSEYIVIDTLIDNIRGATLTKGDKRISERKASSAENDRTGKKAKVKKSRKKAKTRRHKAIQSKSNHADLTTLLGLLNARLPETVAKNMGDPRLNYRTGRFADSTRVVEVTKTPQGFPSIGYTYERDPYQVYESTSGTRFANSDRDPRKIIDGSIREIASQMFLGRLFTRRV